VVDADGILLGIVTGDDLIDVAEAEVTEDFQKSAAVHPLKASCRESSVLSLYTKRVTWLASLLGISVVTTGILSAQADTLNSAIALAFFIPLFSTAGRPFHGLRAGWAGLHRHPGDKRIAGDAAAPQPEGHGGVAFRRRRPRQGRWQASKRWKMRGGCVTNP